jgi:hypothetical protein
VHNAVLGRSKEISRATKTVQHAGSHYASAIRVGVNINLYGSVHPDNAKSSDDFWGVGNLLGSEKKLVVVLLPSIVESLEAIWGKADRSCSCEVEAA